jgi:hypothetical protein
VGVGAALGADVGFVQHGRDIELVHKTGPATYTSRGNP